jgi:hypothetical protein
MKWPTIAFQFRKLPIWAKLCGWRKQVKSLMFGTVVALITFLSLCSCTIVYSTYPLPNPSQSTVDPRLLGFWLNDSGHGSRRLLVHLSAAKNNKVMLIEVIKKNEEDFTFFTFSIEIYQISMFCTNIQKQGYCSLNLPLRAREVHESLSNMPNGTSYLLMKYEFVSEDKVTFFLHPKNVESDISKGRIKGRLIKDGAVLQESTESLHRLISERVIEFAEEPQYTIKFIRADEKKLSEEFLRHFKDSTRLSNWLHRRLHRHSRSPSKKPDGW